MTLDEFRAETAHLPGHYKIIRDEVDTRDFVQQIEVFDKEEAIVLLGA